MRIKKHCSFLVILYTLFLGVNPSFGAEQPPSADFVWVERAQAHASAWEFVLKAFEFDGEEANLQALASLKNRCPAGVKGKADTAFEAAKDFAVCLKKATLATQDYQKADDAAEELKHTGNALRRIEASELAKRHETKAVQAVKETESADERLRGKQIRAGLFEKGGEVSAMASALVASQRQLASEMPESVDSLKRNRIGVQTLYWNLEYVYRTGHFDSFFELVPSLRFDHNQFSTEERSALNDASQGATLLSEALKLMASAIANKPTKEESVVAARKAFNGDRSALEKHGEILRQLNDAVKGYEEGSKLMDSALARLRSISKTKKKAGDEG